MIGPHESGYLYTITKKCYGSTVMVSYGNTMVQNEYNIHATCYPVQTWLKSLSIYLSNELLWEKAVLLWLLLINVIFISLKFKGETLNLVPYR